MLDAKTFAAVTLTLLFWSSAFSAIRIGLRAFGPGELALARYAVASLAFLVYALATKMPMPHPADRVRLLLLGVVGIGVYHTALNFGEVSVPAGTASLIVATTPAFTAALSHAFLKERLSAPGWFGLGVSFAGIALISAGTGEGLRVTTGALLVLIAALATSVFFVFHKPLSARHGSVQLTAYFSWAGTLPMLVFAPGLVRQVAAAPA